MKNDLLLEAIRIGDQLITRAEHNDHGIYWKTAGLANEVIVWDTSENIYNGVSGIALFFIALFQQTNDTKYRQVAEDALRWVQWYCEEHPTSNYALLTGRMGVSLAFLKFYEVTKERRYLVQAQSIAKANLSFLNAQYTLNELISGISGTLLGLLHLYAATNENWIFDAIDKYIQQLLHNARYAKEGLYWDINHYEIHPLCGFSHGVSGIGFVFLELGHYFQNQAFYFIAEQAFAYENNYFDHQQKNWPDFRLNMYTENDRNKLEKQYVEGKSEALTHHGDMNAWCHGSVGIGLSRIRATQLFKNEVFVKDIHRAYKKTSQATIAHFTLCHGGGGNAEFFIENYLLSKKIAALDKAKSIAQQAIEQKKTTGIYTSGLPYQTAKDPEDPSFFNGLAGIGYFFLRVANPEEVPSLLAPKIPAVIKQPLTESHYLLSTIRHTLLSNMFPRTIQKIEQFAPQKIQSFFENDTKKKTELAAFILFAKKCIAALPLDQKHILKGIFTLELAKVQLIHKIKSNGLLYIKQKVTDKTNSELLLLTNEKLLEVKLVLSPEVKLILTADKAFLLKLTFSDVEESPISHFCYKVLQAFTEKKTVKEVIQLIYLYYKVKIVTDKAIVKEKTLAQIKEAISYGILCTEY